MERRYKYEDITRQLYTYFEALHAFHHQRAPDIAAADTNTNRATTTADMMRTQFGFALVKRRSTIPDAGHGTRWIAGDGCVLLATQQHPSPRAQVSSWRAP
jgi:hypothetical protein